MTAKYLLATGLLLITSSVMAQSTTPPRYDPNSYCREVASTVGGSAVIRNSCMDMEQEAYNRLKPAWARLPAQVKSHCNDVARTIGGSYVILEECVKMELEAGNSQRQFRF